MRCGRFAPFTLRPLRTRRDPIKFRLPLQRAFDKLRRSGIDVCLTPLRLSLSKPGVVHAETQSRKGGAEVQGLAAARPFSGAFTARKEWQAAEPQAKPLRAFPFCSASLREQIRLGLQAQRRVECAYRAAPRNDGFRAEAAEGAEAISLRPLRSLRETNQIPVPAIKSLRQAQAERNRCLPNPAQAEPVEAGLAKHPFYKLRVSGDWGGRYWSGGISRAGFAAAGDSAPARRSPGSPHRLRAARPAS